MQEVSKQTGISVSHISRIEKGERLPGYKIFEKLNELYGKEDDNSFSYESGVFMESDYVKIPLINIARKEVFNFALESANNYIKVPQNLKNKIDFAVEIAGDSMNELNIKDGNIVFVKKQATIENGEIAIVLIDGKKATIKQFYKLGDNITLITRSKNPSYSPLIYNVLKTDIKVIGKVVSAYISI
jgi:repressor LexA